MNTFKVVNKFFVRGFLRSLRRVKRVLFPNLELSRIPLLASLANHLIRLSRLDLVDDVQGHKMYVGEKDNLKLSLYGIYEPCETKFFQNEIKRGHIVVDIGANIGYYTLLFAKQVGADGRVFAFEPEAQNFSLLGKNVEMNAYTNVSLVNKAVSHNTGKLRLFVSEDNEAAHSVSDSHDAKDFAEVDCVRLDDYFTNFNREVNFVKMDIEGAEYYAVKGMTSLLQSNPNIVLVTEFWPKGLLHAHAEPRAYLELLLNMGFTIYHLNESNQTIEKGDIQELLQKYTPENEYHCNLIFSRRDLLPGREHLAMR